MRVLRVALVLVATPVWGAGAIEFNYDGSITEATSAFVALTPPGTAVQGTIGIDHAAVVNGRAGPAELDYVHAAFASVPASSGRPNARSSRVP